MEELHKHIKRPRCESNPLIF